MDKIYCFDCRLFKRKFENYFSYEFTKIEHVGARWSQRKFLMPHRVCCHEDCFKIVDGKKVRVSGQAQLNVSNNCGHFKKKKWFNL
jgi:hypothetical protein